MKSISKMLLLATTLSLLMMAPLYATSPQKSTIITINGDDVDHPVDCKGEFTCLLREAGVDFIYRHGGDAVTVFKVEDFDTVCDIASATGKVLSVSTLHEDHTCS